MGKKSHKDRIGVVYSTDPGFEYRHQREEEQKELPAGQQKLRVSIDRKPRKGKEVTLEQAIVYRGQ